MALGFIRQLTDKKKYLLLLFILLANSFMAANLTKGFEALSIHDYFKAKKIFEQGLKKQTPASAYGLSIIYSLNNNPFYNLDSALFYINKSAETFENLTLKQKTKLLKLKVDSLAIYNQILVVDSNCFNKAKEINTIESYTYFINQNCFAIQVNEAISIRNQLAYTIAEKENSSKAYLYFLETYPEASEQKIAKANYEKRLFEEYTEINTLDNNVRFITDYPNNPYINKAHQNVYDIATHNKTIAAFQHFIKTYPNNPYTTTAWRMLYNLSTVAHTPESIYEFVERYPNYPFKNELQKDFKLANSTFYPFQKNNKWGFVDDSLIVVIPAIYDWVSDFNEGVAVVTQNNKFGYINKSGEVVIPFNYDEADGFKNGMAVVSKDEKYGIINRIGEELVPTIYDEIGDTKNQYIAVELNEKYGFIDRLGNLKVGLDFDAVGDFQNGIAYVKKDDKFGIIDTNLYYLVKPKYDWVDLAENNFIRVTENDFYGLINAKGDSILPPIYDHISEFKNGRALIVKDDLYGYINKTGKLVIPITLEVSEGVINWALFNEKGYARISTKGKIGLIDSLGKKFLPALFEDVGSVSKTLIAVKNKGKWGYCDYQAKLKIPYNFQETNEFINGLAIVKSNSLFGIIDENGNFIVPAIYEDIKKLTANHYSVKQNNLVGIINAKNEVIIPIQYSKIELTENKKLIRLVTEESTSYKKL
jgi:hypothetical protein